MDFLCFVKISAWVCCCTCTSPPCAVACCPQASPALPWSVSVLASFCVQSHWAVGDRGLGAHRVNGVASPVLGPSTVWLSLSGFSCPVLCRVACGLRDLHVHVGGNLCPRDL